MRLRRAGTLRGAQHPFASDTDFYDSHWKNDEYGSLVHQAATLTDQDKRAELYSQAEAILVEEAVFIPFDHATSPYLIKPWVVDVVHQGVGFDIVSTTKIAEHSSPATPRRRLGILAMCSRAPDLTLARCRLYKRRRAIK